MSRYTFGRHNAPLFLDPLCDKEPFPWLSIYIHQVSQGEDTLKSIQNYYRVFRDGIPYRNWWIAQVETEWFMQLIVFDPWEQRMHQEATNRLDQLISLPDHLVFEAHF
ncbi:MAG: hypothetical protein ACO4CS_18190 [bacterium]